MGWNTKKAAAFLGSNYPTGHFTYVAQFWNGWAQRDATLG
ncbi:MAG: hypothetical protein JWR26_1565 [Pedosphaera sp.]|nr:hypothetical protein [Pedosphaera sp.]